MFFSAIYTSTFLVISAAFSASATPLPSRTSEVTITSTFSGDGTWYDVGLGACGFTNSDNDFVVAIGHSLFDNYPGYNGANPNDNPVCGRTLTAKYEGNSVTVDVVDRCTGCNTYNLDFSPTAFEALADLSVGRIYDVEWSFD